MLCKEYRRFVFISIEVRRRTSERACAHTHLRCYYLSVLRDAHWNFRFLLPNKQANETDCAEKNRVCLRASWNLLISLLLLVLLLLLFYRRYHYRLYLPMFVRVCLCACLYLSNEVSFIFSALSKNHKTFKDKLTCLQIHTHIQQRLKIIHRQQWWSRRNLVCVYLSLWCWLYCPPIRVFDS